ncbi:MAG: DUF167 family protein [Acidiferrobacterales bacterium]
MAERAIAAASWDGVNLVLRLRIQPRARRDEIVGMHGDCIKVRISAPPVEGLANARLVEFLAECFGVAKSSVILLHGRSGKTKLARVLSPAKLPPQIRPETTR